MSLVSERMVASSPRWPRWSTIGAGAWLVVSAFAWPHAPEAETNTWIFGLLFIGAGAWSLYASGVRVVSAMIALWSAISVIIMPTTPPTIANNLIVSTLVFALSLVPGRLPRPRSHSLSF